MALAWKCDFCSKFFDDSSNVKTIEALSKNGRYYMAPRDICIDCIKEKFPELFKDESQ